MRTPTWEVSPGALVAFLNGNVNCFKADLYTIQLNGGAVIRYTSADVPVSINGNTFGVGPVITRGKTKLAVGISVDTLEVTLSADSTVQINGVPLLPFIAAGGFDASRILLERAFCSAPNAGWVGSYGLFRGRMNDVKASRYAATLTINSDSELLNAMVPRNVYQPGCSNTLFDDACGLSKSAFAVAVTASGATDSTLTTFNVSSGLTVNRFAQGFAVGTSGANAGVARTLKSNASGSLTAIRPWPAAVQVGDGFTIYPGCDKQQSTCSGKFGNLVRFRGQPYVPAPETII